MLLPRFSTRSALIILAVAAVVFAILSQGLLGIQDRWQSERDENYAQDPFDRSGEFVSVWRQVCAGLSIAVVALAVLMSINAVFFLAAWLFGFGGGSAVTGQAASGVVVSLPPAAPVVGRVHSTTHDSEPAPAATDDAVSDEGQSASPLKPAGPPNHD